MLSIELHIKKVILLTLFLLFSQLLSALNIDNIEAGFQTNNVLRYDVSFSTNDTATTYITYYTVQDNDTIVAHTGLSPQKTTHNLTIVGLRPNADYQYKIVAFNPSAIYETDLMSFTTDSLPTNMGTFDLITKKEEAQEGYILSNYIPQITGNTPMRSMFLLDKDAQIIWYETPSNDVTSFNVTPRNTLIYNLLYPENENTDDTLILTSPIIEVNWKGEVLTEIENREIVHHDIFMSQYDSSINILTAEAQIVDRTFQGGLENHIVVGDAIISLDQEGQVLSKWSSFDSFDLLEYVGIYGGFAFWNSIFGSNSAEDWLHGNAFNEDTDGHFLFSLRHHNQIAKVNRYTSELMWVIGENAAITLPDSSLFVGQHSINTTPTGTYLLFDNGDFLRPFSRALEFEVDTVTQVAKVVWEYRMPDSLFNFAVSSAYRLPNNNTLICGGFTGHILEVTPDKEIVWLAKYNANMYRAYHIPHLYEPLPEITLQLPSAFCPTDTLIRLQASPSGGFFQGNGIENGQFNPQLAGVGTHSISYTYGWKTIEQEITVIEAPQIPTIQYEQDTLRIENNYTNASFQWFLNDEPIPNATQAFYVPNQSGNYTVAVSNEATCTSFAQTVNVVLTNVVNPQNLPIAIHTYPNPVNDFFFIGYTLEQLSQVRMDLYQIDGSFSGNLLQQQQTIGQYQQKIDLDKFALSSGLYIVHITINQQSFYQKILIN